MKINATTKANYYVPLDHKTMEKWNLCTPNLRVKTQKNDSPKVYVTSWAPKKLARSRLLESRSPGGGGFSLRTGHCSAEGQFGYGKARVFGGQPWCGWQWNFGEGSLGRFRNALWAWGLRNLISIKAWPPFWAKIIFLKNFLVIFLSDDSFFWGKNMLPLVLSRGNFESVN